MLATPGGKPFTSADWLYELKFDGYRCLARVQDGKVELRTKAGNDCTAWYPEVAQTLATLPGGPHVIDAEACVLDQIGRSDFNLLHERAARRGWYAGCPPVTLCAFDLLFEGGRNLMALPLVQRKARLRRLLVAAPGVLFVGDLPCETDLFSQTVAPLRLEGFVAKRRASVCRAGTRSPDWLKIKRSGWQEGRHWRS